MCVLQCIIVDLQVVGDVDEGEDKGADKGEAKDDEDYLNLFSIHLRAESEKWCHRGMKSKGKLDKGEDEKVQEIERKVLGGRNKGK